MISAEKRQLKVTYYNETLPPLFIQQNYNAAINTGINGDTVSLIKAYHTLLCATNIIANKAIITHLQKLADEGIHIYLLLGNEQLNKAAIETLAGRCLIRTGVVQNGSLVIADQEKAWILSNTLESSQYTLALESDQIEDLYRTFCHLFWREATQEILQPQQTHKANNPVGNIHLNQQYTLKGNLAEKLNTCLNRATTILMTKNWQAIDTKLISSQQKILVDLNKITAKQLQDIANKSSNIYATEQTDQMPIPELILGNETDQSWQLPQFIDNNHVNWAVQLSPQQRQSYLEQANQWLQQSPWKLVSEIKVKDITSKFRLLSHPPQLLEYHSHRAITLKDIFTTHIDTFLTTSVEEMTVNSTIINYNQLAGEIEYQVKIHPPYLPEKATLDPLVQQWNKAQLEWEQQIKDLQQQVINLQQKPQSLSNHLLDRLKQLFISEEEVARKLTNALQKLAQWQCYYQRPSERNEKLELINKIAESIAKQKQHRITRIDEEDQRQNWEKRAEELSHQLAAAQHDYAQKQTELDQLLAPIENITETTEIEDNETTEETQSDTEIVTKNVATQTHQNFLKKFEQRKKGLTEAVKRAKNHYESLLKQKLDHGDHFIYHPRNKNDQAIFKKNLGMNEDLVASQRPITIHWPTEELPTIGSHLYKAENKRWLVIENRDQLQQAYLDAERLNATICVKRN